MDTFIFTVNRMLSWDIDLYQFERKRV